MPYGERDPNFWILIGIIIAAIGVTVAIIALFVPELQLPTAPIFEGGGDTDTDGNYEISWDSSERAIFYILQESGNSSFMNSITVYRGSAKNAYIYGRPNGVYYYRVKGGNEAGESGWSATRRISVTISLPTGAITMSSSPTGASIYLDDRYRGNTPQTITAVSTGIHNIELRLEGYEVWSERVQVMAGETTYVDATLTHIPTEPSTELSTGAITMSSSPSGVSIYLDGEYMGNTPQTITAVSTGIHNIELRLEGYEVWSERVQVMAGETTYVDATLTHIPAEPSTELSTGAITMSSSPSGVSIYLDGEYMGNTPQTITAVSPGTHTIELRLEGYEVWSERVQVMAGETTYVDATLTHIPAEPSTELSTGAITMSSSPSGVSIYLDGEYMGNTPQTITAVSPGTHTIELRLEGYEVWSERVQVMAGETTYVDATLTHIPAEPSTPPIPTPTSITLTYHDFDLNDVCTPEDNYCGWASVPGKAVVYGSMTTDINVPEGASELEVTISICCNGYGEGLSGQPNSSANIRVDSEERAERIDSTMLSHHGNYYKYEWCDTFSNTFNVRGGEAITLIIEMSGGARLDFDQAELTFS